MKKMMNKNAMIFAILFSLSFLVAGSSFAQETEELSGSTINKEIDQELTMVGQNPNLKSQSTSTVRKVTKTSSVQSTPSVVSSTTTTSTLVPRASTQTKKTVVTTKTINELPVKVPVKSTTTVTTTTSPKTKSTVTQKSAFKKSTLSQSAPAVVPAVGGVQKQPITFIEASPLSESTADTIRRRRQDEEMRTESKIVEKLEQSRMEDERRRAEALFGDRLDPKAVVEPTQAIIEQETTTLDKNEKTVATELEDSTPLMIEETTTTQSETNIGQLQKEPGFFDSKYVGLTAGVPGYPDYQNIKGDYNVGLKFGMGHDRFLFEMGLSMAQFTIQDSFYNYGPYAVNSSFNSVFGFANNGQVITNRADFELKQYSGSLGGRYQILDGFIRPNVGGEFVYSYRQYSSLETTWSANSIGVISSLPSGTNFGDSHALDFGVLAGVDLAINQNFLIGADFKYLMNVAYRINGDNSTAGTPIEKLQHFVGGLSAVFKF